MKKTEGVFLKAKIWSAAARPGYNQKYRSLKGCKNLQVC